MSIGGGDEPVWSADSRELFYFGADQMMMAATISGTSAPQVTERRGLFSSAGLRAGGNPRLYHVAPDGRFLMMRLPELGDDASEGFRVVLNWFEELRERVPVD